MVKVFKSPYSVFSDNPISNIDINGDSDTTVTMPNGGKMQLPDGAKITAVHKSNEGTINVGGKERTIAVAENSVFQFEFRGDVYHALSDSKDGQFLGFGKNMSTTLSLGYGADKIVYTEFGLQKPQGQEALAAGALVMESTPGGPAPKAVTGTVITITAAVLTTITIQTIVRDLHMTESTNNVGGYVYSGKTLDDLVPGSIKRSPSWNDGYGSKTPDEIKDLAKAGDRVAQKMKKLWEQADRLLQKNKNK